jgi:hypothetical protein
MRHCGLSVEHNVLRVHTQIASVDLVADSGPFAATTREFTVTPATETLEIELTSVVDNAQLNGLEIFSAGAPS